MRPINGLYVLRLETAQLQQQQQSKEESKDRKEDKATSTTSAAAPETAGDQPSPASSSFSAGNNPVAILETCRLLCRLRFDGVRSGAISGSVKLVAMNPNNGGPSSSSASASSPSSSSSAASSSSSSVSALRATLTSDGHWRYDNEHGYAVDAEGIVHIEFEVHLDQLEGALLQVAQQLMTVQQSKAAAASASLSAESGHNNNNNNNNNNHRDSTATSAGPPTRLALRFSGTMCVGQAVGRAVVQPDHHLLHCSTTVSGTSIFNPEEFAVAAAASDLRLVMTEVISGRCVCCGDPISLTRNVLNDHHYHQVGSYSGNNNNNSNGSSSSKTKKNINGKDATPSPTSSSSALSSSPSLARYHHPENSKLEYCSQRCQEQHVPAASILLPHIQPYTTTRAARCVASFSGMDFTVFWRAATATTFLILVDPSNPLGVCYELLVDVLLEARQQGLRVNIIHDGRESSANGIEPHQLLTLNTYVYECVIRSAVAHNCPALAAACLNQLHLYCDHAAFVERQYLNFYDLCVGGGWDGLRVISTLGEYVMTVRPLFECASVLIEAALKSTMAADFWVRLEGAKGVLISLYNINGSVNFTPAVQHLRATLVPEQQRETLLLLAKVFLIMAARAPPEQSARLLMRAEECYTDAIEEDRLRQNLRRMALSTLSMSALCLLMSGNNNNNSDETGGAAAAAATEGGGGGGKTQQEEKAAMLRSQGIQLLQSVSASPTAHRQAQQHCISTVISTIGTSDELGLDAIVSHAQLQKKATAGK